MNKIYVELGDRRYPIVIGHSMLSQLPEFVRQITGKNCFVVMTDHTVAKLYLETFATRIQVKGLHVESIVIPTGEKNKSLAIYDYVITKMVAKNVGRDWPLIAFGGGVIGDLAGFVAATYMRGLRYIQVPTTLLAQVDSSVGGKVGINHPKAKNLLGAFYQPELVWIDTASLASLPQREVISGLAEVVKYGVIYDDRFFRFCERQLQQLLQLEKTAIAKAISQSCAIKAAVVAYFEFWPHGWPCDRVDFRVRQHQSRRSGFLGHADRVFSCPGNGDFVGG